MNQRQMLSKAIRFIVAGLVALVSLSAFAQRPAPPPLAVPSPNYITIDMEIDVNKPAADVWKRIGKYCDIAEWLAVVRECTMLSGNEGEVGSVRSVANEILVGKTELSYTYTQPVREGRLYNLYHGTLEARPVDANTSKIVYTLMYDNSLVKGDEAAKQAEMDRRRSLFMGAMKKMKELAEAE